MTPAEPSRTAWGAARHRAAHQLVEGGEIFGDPFAVAILGADPDGLVADAAGHSERAGLRRFIALRSRFAEDKIAEAVAQRDVRQLVVLGPGFDTYAWRNPSAGRLRVFEVDHPATQAWKRERVRHAGMGLPKGLVLAPVDFERQSLADGLANAGFDSSLRSFFMWLGVVPYLSAAAIDATLATIASLRGGSELVFDYPEPVDSLGPQARAGYEALGARVAAAGEPFRSFFDPAEFHARLRAQGFTTIEDHSPGSDEGRRHGGHILYAATPAGRSPRAVQQ